MNFMDQPTAHMPHMVFIHGLTELHESFHKQIYEVEEKFLVTVMPRLLFRYRFWYSVVFEWVLW